MPDYAQLVSKIPFLSGYNAEEDRTRAANAQGLQQVQQFMTMQGAMEQQAQRRQALQREEQRREVVSKLPPNASPEDVAAAVRPFAGADDLLRAATTGIENRAKQEAQRLEHGAQREQRVFEITERARRESDNIEQQARERRISRAEADERQAALMRKLTEDRREAQLDAIRLAASLRAPAQPHMPPTIATDQGLFERTPQGLQPIMNPNNPGQQLRPPSLVSGGNQQAMRLRGEYNSNPEVKLANMLEPKVGTAADYVASVGRGMGNSVGDAELVKLWLMTTHPKGDQISNMDYMQIAKMPDLAGRISNVAGNFVFGKTLDSDTRKSMWKSVSEKYKATEAMREKVKADVRARGRAMNLNDEALFSAQPVE